MSRVVVDIETVGAPLESFDDVQQEYLLKFSDTEEKKAETIQKFSLYPTTAQIIVIGMLNPDTGHGKVLFQSDKPTDLVSDDGAVRFLSGSDDPGYQLSQLRGGRHRARAHDGPGDLPGPAFFSIAVKDVGQLIFREAIEAGIAELAGLSVRCLG